MTRLYSDENDVIAEASPLGLGHQTVLGFWVAVAGLPAANTAHSLCPSLPTSRQILGRAWVRSGGLTVGQTGFSGKLEFWGSGSLRESAVVTNQTRADNLLDTHRLYFLYFDFMNHSRTQLRSQHR